MGIEVNGFDNCAYRSWMLRHNYHLGDEQPFNILKSSTGSVLGENERSSIPAALITINEEFICVDQIHVKLCRLTESLKVAQYTDQAHSQEDKGLHIKKPVGC